LQEVLKALRPIIPIKEEKHRLELVVPVDQLGSALRVVKGQSKVLREEWQHNGDLKALVEIPGGLSVDFQEALMKATHGKAQFTIISRD
jgi:ribosome maturation protein SDO1